MGYSLISQQRGKSLPWVVVVATICSGVHSSSDLVTHSIRACEGESYCYTIVNSIYVKISMQTRSPYTVIDMHFKYAHFYSIA